MKKEHLLPKHAGPALDEARDKAVPRSDRLDSPPPPTGARSSPSRRASRTARPPSSSRWLTFVALVVTVLAIILALTVIVTRLAAPPQVLSPIGSTGANVMTPTTRPAPVMTPAAHGSSISTNARTRNLSWLLPAIGAAVLIGVIIRFVIAVTRNARRRQRTAMRVSVTPEIAAIALPAQHPLPTSDRRLLLPASPARSSPSSSPVRPQQPAPPPARSLGSMPGIQLPGITLDLNGASTIWLALDLDASVTATTHTLILTIAHSLGIYFMQVAQLQVGLIASGGSPVVLAPQADHQAAFEQQLRRTRAGDAASLTTQIETLRPRFKEGHMVMMMTSRPAFTWNMWVDGLKHAGLTIQVIQVGGTEPLPAITPVQEEMSEVIEHPSLARRPPSR